MTEDFAPQRRWLQTQMSAPWVYYFFILIVIVLLEIQ